MVAVIVLDVAAVSEYSFAIGFFHAITLEQKQKSTSLKLRKAYWIVISLSVELNNAFARVGTDRQTC